MRNGSTFRHKYTSLPRTTSTVVSPTPDRRGSNLDNDLDLVQFSRRRLSSRRRRSSYQGVISTVHYIPLNIGVNLQREVGVYNTGDAQTMGIDVLRKASQSKSVLIELFVVRPCEASLYMSHTVITTARRPPGVYLAVPARALLMVESMTLQAMLLVLFE